MAAGAESVKVLAADGSYLGRRDRILADKVVAAGLGAYVDGYLLLASAAHRGGGATMSDKPKGMDGWNVHQRATKSNPAGVWTFDELGRRRSIRTPGVAA